MPICACGCGKSTKGGKFLPGHDSKLRAYIEKSVGGLLNLKEIIEAAIQFTEGNLSDEEYLRITRKLLASERKA